MSTLLVVAMTWLKALSPSPVLLPPRRRRPRCVVVVVVVVVAFLCRRGLLRCVAVALFVVVAWVEVLNLCFVLALLGRHCLESVLLLSSSSSGSSSTSSTLVCFTRLVVVVVGRRRRRGVSFSRYFAQGSLRTPVHKTRSPEVRSYLGEGK